MKLSELRPEEKIILYYENGMYYTEPAYSQDRQATFKVPAKSFIYTNVKEFLCSKFFRAIDSSNPNTFPTVYTAKNKTLYFDFEVMIEYICKYNHIDDGGAYEKKIYDSLTNDLGIDIEEFSNRVQDALNEYQYFEKNEPVDVDIFPGVPDYAYPVELLISLGRGSQEAIAYNDIPNMQSEYLYLINRFFTRQVFDENGALRCPKCNVLIKKEPIQQRFCSNCGQRINFGNGG